MKCPQGTIVFQACLLQERTGPIPEENVTEKGRGGIPATSRAGNFDSINAKIQTGKCPDRGGLFQARTEFISGKCLGTQFQFA
jgi:hypothetical protein